MEQMHGPDLQLRLRRLWKGTLIVGISGAYVLIVLLMFMEHGWRAALLTTFLIALPQFFRYIANDVDQVGWRIAKDTGEVSGAKSDEPTIDSTRRLQSKMLMVLIALIQLSNIALLYQTYALSGVNWAVALVLTLFIIEILYSQIRRVNREVQFERASFGSADHAVYPPGPELTSPPDVVRQARLDAQLDVLAELVKDGKISAESFAKARDNYRIRSVMEESSS